DKARKADHSRAAQGRTFPEKVVEVEQRPPIRRPRAAQEVGRLRRNAIKRKLLGQSSSTSLANAPRVAKPLAEEELEEFRTLLLGYFGSRRKALKFIDDNNSGEISRSEFQAAMSTLLARISHPGNVRTSVSAESKAADTLDADGSGSISPKELLPSPELRQKEWSLMTTDEKWNRYLGESVQHPEKRAWSDDEDD
ncbi:hypothetical protein FOZ62_007559, partial [Perkinsus olseni]